MQPSRIALVVFLLSGGLEAQTIDPAEYMPLGLFSRWELVNAADPLDTLSVHVRNVTVVDLNPQYSLRFRRLGDIKDPRFVVGFEDGDVVLYAVKVTGGVFDDDVKLTRIDFTEPIVIGSPGTQIDGPGVTANVNTQIKFSVDVGTKSFSGKIDVTGTVGARWASAGAVTTPAGTFGADEVARLVLDFSLSFFSDDVRQFDIDEFLFDSSEITLARGVGVVRAEAAGFLYLLNRAIVNGRTVGDFPPPVADVTQFSMPTPGLLSLAGAAEGSATDGFITLSDLKLEQHLGGKLKLTGMADVAAPGGGQETAVPLTMTGKVKAIRSGGAKLSLKGKTGHESLPKKLSLKAVAIIDEGTTEVTIDYKAGKDETGNPIAGTITLGIAPEAVNSTTIQLNGMVDTVLEPGVKKRKLGSEGILTLGSVSYPVKLTESVKIKEGLPNKHAYKLVETGTSKPALAKFGATSTDAADYALTKFKAKLLGLKIKPAELDEIQVEAE